MVKKKGLASLPGFAALENTIDTSGLSAQQAAEIILRPEDRIDV